jgi:cobalt/nickel transport system ATP-binding protein
VSHHLTEVRDLQYHYPDGTPGLQGVTFRIRHGESVGIVGANGAGKSTLLLLLTGILTPTAGEIAIGETRLTMKTLNTIRQRLGMVFQDPDDQLFMTTVFEDVAFGLRNMGLAEDEVERRVEAALGAVGVPHLRERPPFKLSAGEKRAAAIATVLAMEPDILLLDEPSSALDPRARRRLIGILKGFSHTKIVTSHDLDLVLELCPRTIILQQGRVLRDGASDRLLADAALMSEAGLELPQRIVHCRHCEEPRRGRR